MAGSVPFDGPGRTAPRHVGDRPIDADVAPGAAGIGVTAVIGLLRCLGGFCTPSGSALAVEIGDRDRVEAAWQHQAAYGIRARPFARLRWTWWLSRPRTPSTARTVFQRISRSIASDQFST